MSLDLDDFDIKRDLRKGAAAGGSWGYATTRDLSDFAIAIRSDLADCVTASKRDSTERRETTRRDIEELHRHFDVVMERFKSESLETGVTNFENRRK